MYGGFQVPAKTQLVEDAGEFTIGDNIQVRSVPQLPLTVSATFYRSKQVLGNSMPHAGFHLLLHHRRLQ
jgi:hypothetical protein